MNQLKYYLPLLLLFQIHQFAIAQDLFETDKIPVQNPKNLDIYLVIGQSNMAGRATIRDEDKLSIEHAYLFTGSETTPWVGATNPLNRYSSARKAISMQRLSPAYAFARSIAAAETGNEIGLVMNAKGGTKIVQWLPGSELYLSAIKRTHDALKHGVLKGVIWHQGEADCDPIRVNMYLGRLEIIINALREEFDNETLPFVAGQLFENESRHVFNQMILQLPDFIINTGVAISDGTSVSDGTHFDSKSAIILGDRYAKEMKRIQKVLKNNK
jgi:hypothetical protein